MASLTVIYWRDIPAQVVVEEGRGRGRNQAKAEMPRRFALAIDEAAMQGDAASTDDYLSEWRKSTPITVEGDLKTLAESKVSELDQLYDKDKLSGLVANGGVDGRPS